MGGGIPGGREDLTSKSVTPYHREEANEGALLDFAYSTRNQRELDLMLILSNTFSDSVDSVISH